MRDIKMMGEYHFSGFLPITETEKRGFVGEVSVMKAFK